MRSIILLLGVIIICYYTSCGIGFDDGFSDYKIAYVPNDQSSALYVMNADGSGKQILYQEVGGSSSIKSIFWDISDNIYFIIHRRSHTNNTVVHQDILYRIDYTSKKLELIFRSDTNIYNLVHDGNEYIAFYETGDAALTILNINTIELKKISSTQMKKYYTLCWTEDPNIILLYTRENSAFKIYQLKLSNSYIYFLGLIENVSYIPFPSPDGKKIAYRGVDNYSLSVFDVISLTSKVLIENQYQSGRMIWSYDNLNLVYQYYERDGSKNLFQLNLVNSDTKYVRDIISNNSSISVGTFFPNGEYITLFGEKYIDNPGIRDLIKVNIYTGKSLNLTSNQANYTGTNPLHSISYNIIYENGPNNAM